MKTFVIVIAVALIACVGAGFGVYFYQQHTEEMRPLEITQEDCLGGMVFVDVGTSKFCIDVKEYPDFNSSIPLVNISWKEANKRCEDENKCLPTKEEWNIAAHRFTGEGIEGLGEDYDYKEWVYDGDGHGNRTYLPSKGNYYQVAPEDKGYDNVSFRCVISIRCKEQLSENRSL